MPTASRSADQDAARIGERRSARDGQNPAKIMRAAHRLIGSGGVVATPIEDILRAAGVNRRTFYRHFHSKDALVLDMEREAGETTRHALRAAVDLAADPAHALVAWIEAFLGIGWDEHRARDGRTFLAPEAGLVAGLADALEATYDCHRRILVEVLELGLADGSLPHTEPARDAFAIHAVVLRHIEIRIRGHLDRPFEGVRDDIVALFLPRLSAS